MEPVKADNSFGKKLLKTDRITKERKQTRKNKYLRVQNSVLNKNCNYHLILTFHNKNCCVIMNECFHLLIQETYLIMYVNL